MSTLKVGTIQNASGVEVYTCKAWVNFNGTGTVAIRASGNVSSITDNGTGNYTVNFTTAMADSNYSCVGTSVSTGAAFGAYVLIKTQTASEVNIYTSAYNALQDASTVNVAFFR